MAQLSMHSVRETMGVADVRHCVDHFAAVFEYCRLRTLLTP
jgi:aspartyl aminopeptidase